MEQEQFSMMKVRTAFDNDTVNTQVGTGIDYTRITTVHDGIVFKWVTTLQNGWQAVKIGSQVGWVSGEYSEITTE